jgi:hypothetical protein
MMRALVLLGRGVPVGQHRLDEHGDDRLIDRQRTLPAPSGGGPLGRSFP